MTSRRVSAIVAAVWMLASLATSAVRADEPTDGSPKITVETVVTGLDHPCGVTVQPNSANVFIADSGAGQVVKFSPANSGSLRPVVTGFPIAADKEDAKYLRGPQSLVFLNQNTLVVVGGAAKGSSEVVRVYTLAPWGSADEDKPLEYRAASQRFAPTAIGEGLQYDSSFFGLTLSVAPNTVLYVSVHGREPGRVLKSEVGNRRTLLSIEPVPSITIQPASSAATACGITMNSNGLLLIAQKGKIDPASTCELAFHNAKTGALLMSMQTPLREIVALAYSPESRRLYAADFSSTKPGDAGVYRLDAATIDGRAGVKAVKIAPLQRPSALAFAPDNTLYVTVFGPVAASGDENESRKSGQLVKITGDL